MDARNSATFEHSEARSKEARSPDQRAEPQREAKAHSVYMRDKKQRGAPVANTMLLSVAQISKAKCVVVPGDHCW